MSYALIDTTDLTALGNAIRTKSGGSSNLTIAEMASAVNALSIGSGLQPLVISGSLEDFTTYIFNYALTNLDISFNNITTLINAFKGIEYNDLSNMVINLNSSGNSNNSNVDNYIYATNCFQNSTLTYLPNFVFGEKGITDCANLFAGCNNLLSVDDFMADVKFYQSATTTDTKANYSCMFDGCHRLKHIPHLDKIHYCVSYTTSLYYTLARYCYELQEIYLPVVNLTNDQIISTNMFYYTTDACSTLAHYVFETNNGVPYTAKWQKQEIKLGKNKYIGYFSNTSNIKDTSIPLVSGNASTVANLYTQYKNGVYHTSNRNYSRYNHNSAVETINSLPDTSAYVDSNTMNKIYFQKGMGSLTDGGDVNNLTAAEIQVATDKGWQVIIEN